jgi:hypothetical protein
MIQPLLESADIIQGLLPGAPAVPFEVLVVATGEAAGFERLRSSPRGAVVGGVGIAN